MTARALVETLTTRGLLDPASILDAGLTIADVNGRGVSWRVHDGARSLVVKQPAPGREERLRHEVRVLARLGDVAALRPHLPAVCLLDGEQGLLATRAQTGARSLREHHRRLGRYPAPLARALGDALGQLHRLSPRFVANATSTTADGSSWVLALHEPDLDLYRASSGAALELIALVQRFPAFGDGFAALRAAWQPSAATHHDPRWDNVVITPQAGGKPRVTLIDWELARPGDPACDLGTLLGEYLDCWIDSIPFDAAAASAASASERARVPLASLQPAMRACWSGWLAALGPPAGEHPALRARVTSYAGARLVASAWERLRAASALGPRDLLAAQVALNMLARPDDAASTLLGIPDDTAAAR